VDVLHPELADGRRLVRERVARIVVQRQVDDSLEPGAGDVGELRLGRLARRRDPFVDAPEVVDLLERH
jgi:hypothetical protein